MKTLHVAGSPYSQFYYDLSLVYAKDVVLPEGTEPFSLPWIPVCAGGLVSRWIRYPHQSTWRQCFALSLRPNS